MRIKSLMALATIAAAVVTTSRSASAFDWDRPDLRYHAYSQSYADDLDDRYAYFYDPRGYYPYYNSGQWGPPRINRFKGTLPPYYASWGSTKRSYHHLAWHRLHYGGHRRGDW